MANAKSEALKKAKSGVNVCDTCGSKKHKSKEHGKLRKQEGEKLNKSVEKDEEKE